jgi:DNA-binding MarR family transcriptional regulator
VTGTFVTSESGKLSKKGFLRRSPDRQDKRLSLISIAPNGQEALDSLFPELQQINDVFFELDARADFEELCRLLERLVSNSQRALALINATRQDSRLTLNDGGVSVRKRR